MQFDRQILISAAGSRKATQWLAQNIYWSDLIEKLKTPHRSTETLEEYMAMPKSKQDELKDVGGFVGGTLKDNKRKANNVTGRDLITLDLDNIPPGQTHEVIRRIDGLGCAYAVYSTRKHSEAKPRIRAIFPTSRTLTADEYQPIARKIAHLIGMELMDRTTFENSRLMYWPSCCSDSQYVFTFGDKPSMDADGVLGMYQDWKNVSEWPEVLGAQETHAKTAEKQGDPTLKEGIVGAFCKTYDVYRAIENFLPGTYIPTDDGSGRYTFSGGSTVGGAVIYENGNFLYSHHATDPAGGKLCNAFDLVRLHKFSELDDNVKPDTPTNKLPSYTDMCQFAVSDGYVSAVLTQERYEKATRDFGTALEDNANWISKLAVSSTTGNPSKTIDNILIILDYDPLIRGKIAFNEFSNRAEVFGALPWDARQERRTWGNVDDAGLIYYLEKTYSITGDSRIDRAFTLCAHKHSFNEVKDYLTRVSWDGVKRVDTLFIDYLGSVDSPYIRAVARKSLVAAVARAMVPGTKFDTMAILGGPQGIGKSTLLKTIAKDWFSDSLQTFEGKEASEMLQGIWINEIGELNGMSKSETNAVKQFLSRTEDIYREPFGKRTGRYPRRCIFFGTTNDKEYLKDLTGNRRFWPVDVGQQPPTKNVWEQLPEEVDQIWAEVFIHWQLGEKLYLTGDVEEEAMLQQEKHRETDPREGIIMEFVEREVPNGWEKRTLVERKLYWSGEYEKIQCDTVPRDRICAAEVWCECFNGDLKYLKRLDAMSINKVLAKIAGWMSYHGRFACYGQQKGYLSENRYNYLKCLP
jgi:predicted P-loop ATPase